MNKEKISSQEIIDLVASKASVSKRAAEEFLKVMIASVEEGLLAGEVVKIKNFGTFKLQWNEPRKSVNVQTKEEILIAGYYKVVFVPDVILKEQVNEPFAHLEAVELDVQPQKNELVEEAEIISDPLRIFNEQAFEIKNLISEIQALSSLSTNTIPKVSNNPESIIAEDNIEEIIENELIPEDTNNEVEFKLIDEEKIILQEKPLEDKQEKIPDYIPDNTDNSDVSVVEEKINQSVIIESQINSELPATPYLDYIKPTKKRKVWLWGILGLVLIAGLGTGSYFLYTYNEYSINKISQKISITEILNTVSKWFTPAAKPAITPVTVVIPKDTTVYDSISQNQPIDSIQILFDNPRVYNDFIASEKIKAGSRLTIMSKRYYGSKEFWVYIYEANKERITNPDNIAIGTLIRIPKLDPKLIDTTNPRCIEKAKELHDIYIKQ